MTKPDFQLPRDRGCPGYSLRYFAASAVRRIHGTAKDRRTIAVDGRGGPPARRGSPQDISLKRPPAWGKTTLAYIIGNAMGVDVKSTSGPMIEKAGDLAGLLTNIERGGVLFIDEIHRLRPI